MMNRISLVVLIAVVVAVSQAVELQLLDPATGALCLDGSPAGYYLTQNGNASTWIIDFQRGGMCSSAEDCLARSTTELGSSKSWPKYWYPLSALSFAEESGFISDSTWTNPKLASWNKVRVQYCDGDLYSGNRLEPYQFNGSTLYFRGQSIVEAVFDDLARFGLYNATEIIITGCSAGGISVYLHIDWIRKRIPAHIKVSAAPDSGYFMDIPNYKGFKNSTQWNITRKLHNTTFLNEKCKQHNRGEAVGNCIWPSHAAKYISKDIPFYVINSIADSYQIAHTLQLECFQQGLFLSTLGNCSKAELDAVTQFRQTMINSLESSILQSPKNGAFLLSCLTHCGACLDPFWDYASVQSTQLHTAFESWYFHDQMHPNVLIDDPYPSNKCNFSPFVSESIA